MESLALDLGSIQEDHMITSSSGDLPYMVMIELSISVWNTCTFEREINELYPHLYYIFGLVVKRVVFPPCGYIFGLVV